jgi:hypothetical protein
MARFDSDKKFEYHVDKSCDRVFDEKGSTFLAMRRVAWGVSQDEEPEDGKAKLELRRWHIRDNGEMPDKGFTFLTEDGPHELVKALTEEGYGNTKEILNIIKDRDDFEDSVKTLFDDDNPTGDYFDPRSILLGD